MNSTVCELHLDKDLTKVARTLWATCQGTDLTWHSSREPSGYAIPVYKAGSTWPPSAWETLPSQDRHPCHLETPISPPGAEEGCSAPPGWSAGRWPQTLRVVAPLSDPTLPDSHTPSSPRLSHFPLPVPL
jgi:hypothetical protein